MSDIAEFIKDWIDMMNGDMAEQEYNRKYPSPTPTPKNTVVRVSFEPYGDRILYADGHEEWRSIGD